MLLSHDRRVSFPLRMNSTEQATVRGGRALRSSRIVLPLSRFVAIVANDTSNRQHGRESRCRMHCVLPARADFLLREVVLCRVEVVRLEVAEHFVAGAEDRVIPDSCLCESLE